MQAPVGVATTTRLVEAVSRVGGLGTLAGSWTEPAVLGSRCGSSARRRGMAFVSTSSWPSMNARASRWSWRRACTLCRSRGESPEASSGTPMTLALLPSYRSVMSGRRERRRTPERTSSSPRGSRRVATYRAGRPPRARRRASPDPRSSDRCRGRYRRRCVGPCRCRGGRRRSGMRDCVSRRTRGRCASGLSRAALPISRVGHGSDVDVRHRLAQRTAPGNPKRHVRRLGRGPKTTPWQPPWRG